MTRLSEDPIEVHLDGVTHAGEGVGRVFVEDDGTAVDGRERGGKAVFVPGGLPGERVRIRVVDDRRTWARAELLDVIEPSPDRIDPPCPYAMFGSAPGPPCGGCQLQHVSEAGEARLKRRITVEQLERIGKIDDPPVEPVRPVGPSLNYRVTARFHATPEGDLGFHTVSGDAVRPIDRCLIVNEGVQAMRDRTPGAGGADAITFRAVPETGTRAVVLHPGSGGLELPELEADVALAQPDGAAKPMRGEGILRATVAGFSFHFGVSAFFQVSVAAAAALLDEVRLAVGDPVRRHVWDLYAGVGLFALPLAADGADVVAVESQPVAVEWLRRNAEDHGVPVTAVEDDVEDWLSDAPRQPDVVVLDPPRGAAGLEAVRAIAALDASRIVYVSCDVPAFARDAGDLVSSGYDLVRVQPLDCFPQTRHIEVVAAFER